LDRCRYGEHKPTCKQCPIHCYRPEMKEKIRGIMRWAGPRMILYHPIAAIRHLLRESGVGKAGMKTTGEKILNQLTNK
ncbi:MAG: nitrous oxide-stimulated promoter family protein, partial [Prevotella sp.]|nr:nitrous oxide-stimulated promoter family protein [Prevotella sp.]